MREQSKDGINGLSVHGYKNIHLFATKMMGLDQFCGIFNLFANTATHP